MDIIENMSFEEFRKAFISETLPHVVRHKPEENKVNNSPFDKPNRIYRLVTGVYYNYIEWAYNNRGLLRYMDETGLFHKSNYWMEMYTWVDQKLEEICAYHNDSHVVDIDPAISDMEDYFSELFWNSRKESSDTDDDSVDTAFEEQTDDFNIIDSWV